MASAAAIEPTNKHISVDPVTGQSCYDLSYEEEPLGAAASDGYGFAQFKVGEVIGPDQRYLLARKLGWGMSSSTWLARDQK
jgi:hypothetical protein